MYLPPPRPPPPPPPPLKLFDYLTTLLTFLSFSLSFFHGPSSPPLLIPTFPIASQRRRLLRNLTKISFHFHFTNLLSRVHFPSGFV
jgi:hypothetical protein